MFNIVKRLSTHSGKLERWIGREHLEQVSASMREWYGPPIAMAGVPGAVYANKGGDFVGNIDGGSFANYVDHMRTRARRAFKAWSRAQSRTMNAGFASVAAVQAAVNLNNRQILPFSKNYPTLDSARQGADFFLSSAGGPPPAAGGPGAAAPGGTAWANGDNGTLQFIAPPSGDTMHFAAAEINSNTAAGSYLLYDRLFSVAKTMNDTGTEAVTGVPSRYQSTTPGDPDYASGNFLFISAPTTLPAGAHIWDECTYVDQDGNTGAILPPIAGISGCNELCFDMAIENWFAPLAPGDHGILSLTQMQCDTAIATGTISFSIGHPIAWLPPGLGSGMRVGMDGIIGTFQPDRVFDTAALSIIGACGGSSGSLQASISLIHG